MMRDVDFEAPRDGDPDFIVVNATFYAIAQPHCRRILEILDGGALPIDELNINFNLNDDDMGYWIDYLKTVGFIEAVEMPAGTMLRLNAAGYGRVRAWIDGFNSL